MQAKLLDTKTSHYTTVGWFAEVWPCVLQESAVSYQVRLKNGFRIRVHVFAVYDSPREVVDEEGKIEYEWPCITRAACPKQHCEVSRPPLLADPPHNHPTASRCCYRPLASIQ